MTGERAERLQQLRRQTEEPFPENWSPTEQDPMLAGEFVRLEHGHTRFGERGIAIVRLDDGTLRSVWILSTALQSQFQKKRPRPGDLICIRWLGLRAGASGNDYNDFRVEVDRGQDEVDWGGLTAGGDEELEELNGRSLEHLPEQAQQPPIRRGTPT
jgi:hypothetical protein